jgi:hypothetical protein
LNWVQLATAALVVSLAFTAAVYLLLGAEERATLKAIIVRWKK